ncbi:MAG: hypothetical protein Q9M26_05880 [Mariprofundales bacterium]|nr:hypothetical protein [Mariprofundales bacterium]
MQVISRIIISLALLAATTLAWVAWNPPLGNTLIRKFRISIPPEPTAYHQLWQVTTRPLLRQADAEQIKQRLVKLGFTPRIITAHEQRTWMRFWDPVIYASPAPALEALARWKQHGIQATQTHDDAGYHLELGRESNRAAIAGAEQKLTASGLKFSKKSLVLMTDLWRLQFAPQSQDDADITWRVLQEQGMTDPVMQQVAPTNMKKGHDANH